MDNLQQQVCTLTDRCVELTEELAQCRQRYTASQYELGNIMYKSKMDRRNARAMLNHVREPDRMLRLMVSEALDDLERLRADNERMRAELEALRELVWGPQ